MRKLYCYVDESGQETKGKLFLVSLVITDNDPNELRLILEKIEGLSGKNKNKWTKTRDTKRLLYIRDVLQNPSFKGRLYFALFENTIDYVALTAQATAQAIVQHTQVPYKATIVIDGLRKSEYQAFTKLLREQGVRTEKVRGADDQNEPLIRLCDALCGFLRDALEGRPSFKVLLEKALKEEYLIDLYKQKPP